MKLRKRRTDLELVVDALARERGVEFRQHLTRAELELNALAPAILQLGPVDREREVDRRDVSRRGRTRRVGGLEARVSLAQQLDLLLDHRFGRQGRGAK